jgi:predicted amino acid dehydrogenase
MTNNFAFIIHPINPQRDVARKFPRLGKLPPWLIDFASLFFPPVFISEIAGIQSTATGEKIKGWFIACPLTPNRMMSLPTNIVYRKLIQTGKMAEKLGANILGLGAFTSVVGDGGLTVSKSLTIPVTTGDSYTVAVAVSAVRAAAARMQLELTTATVAVVGAAGAIGAVCAEMLASDVANLILVGHKNPLDGVVEKCRLTGATTITTSTDMNSLREADIVITVTSAIDSVIEPQHLKSGAIVCDVARPRDVSRQVADTRPDVFVFEGGMVEVPGNVDFGFDFGFPPKMAFACMAETMTLALDNRLESYTLGKDVTLSQVLTIDRIAHNHGFKLGGFRSFERAITNEQISAIRQQAKSKMMNGAFVASG